MKEGRHSLRVAWTLALCTSLSLLGDATIYPVLPSQFEVVGITALQVGWLLSINRLVRPPLNMISGWLSSRVGPRTPYIVGLLIGAFSTLGYGLVRGFVPLLACRALWGVAWSLIAVSAYGMVLDVTELDTRGRLAGIYASFSYFGGALGAMFGGFLVDALGFSRGMLILGACTLLGGATAWTLPRPQRRATRRQRGESPLTTRAKRALYGLRHLDRRLWLILALSFAHRFFFAGVFSSTFGLYLRNALGDRPQIGQLVVGIASLAAILFFLRNLISVLVGPLLGYLSDRLGDRTRVLVMGEAMGVLALLCLAAGKTPWLVGLGVILAAIAYGIVPPMLVSWMGDLTHEGRRGLIVGGYQTMGDIGSGLGPLVAYSLVVSVGTRPVYAAGAGLLALTIPLIIAARGQALQPPLSSRADSHTRGS